MRLNILFVTLLFCLRLPAQETWLLAGTYDSPKSEGIYVYRFNARNGSATLVSQVRSSNPSYLAISPTRQWVYAVNENADSTGRAGGVSAFRFDSRKGTLQELGKVSSEGNHPCYLAFDGSGRWVVAGNYSSGNFSVIPASEEGHPGRAQQVVRHSGSGPDSTRQRSPHVHCTLFDQSGHYLYVADLGTDGLYGYRFNAQSGQVTEKALWRISFSGDGPRHIEPHPNGRILYLVQELTGRVMVLEMKSETEVSVIQTVSTLPSGYQGQAGSADIHLSPDGRFLYATNRGNSNTLAIFKVKKRSGKLVAKGHISTGGEKPRHFSMDPSGKYLLVANQQSDEIVVFKRNVRNGKLTDAGQRIGLGKPVCLKWITVP